MKYVGRTTQTGLYTKSSKHELVKTIAAVVTVTASYFTGPSLNQPILAQDLFFFCLLTALFFMKDPPRVDFPRK